MLSSFWFSNHVLIFWLASLSPSVFSPQILDIITTNSTVIIIVIVTVSFKSWRDWIRHTYLYDFMLSQFRTGESLINCAVATCEGVWYRVASKPFTSRIPQNTSGVKSFTVDSKKKKPGYKDSGINNFLSLSNTNREVKQWFREETTARKRIATNHLF